ncbi:MAG: PDZ domain-containing protein [Spirochaetota bacterium]
MNAILLRLQRHNYVSLFPFILFFAFSAAYLMKTFVLLLFPSHSWQNPFTSLSSKTNSKKTSYQPLEHYIGMVEGNLIRSQLEQTKQTETPTNTSSFALADNPQIDGARITGIVSGSPSFARTTIRLPKERSAEEYSILQKVGPYQILAIQAQKIILALDDQHSLTVYVGESIADAKKRYLEANPVRVAENTPSSGQTYKKIIAGSKVKELLNNPPLKRIQLGPNLVNDKIDGYKVYKVGTKSPFYSLGCRDGDIIKRVNGMPLQDTKKMMQIYNSLSHVDTITLDIERNGQIVTYEFHVRN